MDTCANTHWSFQGKGLLGTWRMSLRSFGCSEREVLLEAPLHQGLRSFEWNVLSVTDTQSVRDQEVLVIAVWRTISAISLWSKCRELSWGRQEAERPCTCLDFVKATKTRTRNEWVCGGKEQTGAFWSVPSAYAHRLKPLKWHRSPRRIWHASLTLV